MTAFIFLGPTLPLEEARRRCDANYLPPVRAGDLLRAVEQGASVIGIIDADAAGSPSERDAEIRLAQSRGVPVFGVGVGPSVEQIALEQEDALALLDMLSAMAAQPEKGAHLGLVVRGGETLKVVRKKVLLRILAVREAEHLGLEISAAEVQVMADDFRRQYGLTSTAAMKEFLSREAIELDDFAEMMREFAAVRAMERRYADEIDRAVSGHIRLTAGAKAFLAERTGGSIPE